MRKIPLTQGMVALVDDDDYEWLMQWKWFAHKSRNKWYAARNRQKSEPKGSKTIKMHREINKTPKGIETDHADTESLNNQKYNLRNATNAQNQYNKAPLSGRSSIFRGVGWHKSSKKWMAKSRVGGKVHFIGSFNCEIEAAKSYDNFAKNHHGEFAYLNFPEEAR